MSRFNGKMLDGLVPYVAGEQPKDMKYIKLNTNENPYSPSPKVKEAIDSFDYSTLKLYPDPDVSELREAIGEFYGVKTENIFCGNSSDEIIAMAFMAFFTGDKPLVFPDITYSFYPVWCDIFGIKKQIVPLKEDWTIDFENFPKNAGGIVICNPNAPTGIAVKMAQIEEILQKFPDTLILCDEAYIDFGGESSIELTKKYDNLLVVHTLSKSRSLAGARVGFAIGNAELISSLNVIKNSFNSYTIDRLALKIAVAAVKDSEYFENCCKKVIGTRNWAVAQLKELGFDILESSANFVFARPTKFISAGISAEELYKKLKANGILVRFWNKPKISDWLRITIGTDGEMKALIDKIKEMQK
ncbi:MAG: histidinol-phosphate transaminase [Chitinivibrionia bacterium]|nr:histidinol-phosphate transaminase [Chitinivibrionia bacterium]